MRWENILETWDWLFQQLSNPEIIKALAFLTIFASVAAVFLTGVVRWLMERHFSEAMEHLLQRYERRNRFLGIPKAPLAIIAECMAVIFALKLTADLTEPFVLGFLSPKLSVQMLGMARYDWLILCALSTLLIVFWGRFCWHVCKHDAKQLDSKIDRNWTRTIRVFCRPAIGLLFLMFLPDIGRFSSALAAGWLKSAMPTLASEQAAPDEALMERHFGRGLQAKVILVPRERLAAEK